MLPLIYLALLFYDFSSYILQRIDRMDSFSRESEIGDSFIEILLLIAKHLTFSSVKRCSLLVRLSEKFFCLDQT